MGQRFFWSVQNNYHEEKSNYREEKKHFEKLNDLTTFLFCTLSFLLSLYSYLHKPIKQLNFTTFYK